MLPGFSGERLFFAHRPYWVVSDLLPLAYVVWFRQTDGKKIVGRKHFGLVFEIMVLITT